QARREVAAALAGTALSHLTDDAELVVSELVGNALLHGAPPVRLSIDVGADRVRLGVFDGSATPPGRNNTGEAAMTGRGLMVVDALTVSRGVERQGSGKQVWAELSGGTPGNAGALPGASPSPDDLLEAWAEPDMPEDLVEVDLGEVSTSLLLAAKIHTDNLIREFSLALVGAESGASARVPEELARLIATVTTEFADLRRELKEQALAAQARGDERTHLRLSLTPRALRNGERYLEALDEADAYCRAGRLLSLEMPPQHKVFRRWYVGELTRQVQRSLEGLPPDAPRTFEDRLLDELSVLAEAQRAADRAARLYRVSASLSAASTAERVAQVVLEEAVPALGATGGGLLVPAGAKLALPGVVGYRDELVSALRDEPAEADLPAAVALRTRQPVWLESAEELDRRFPQVRRLEPETEALCAVPLSVDSSVGAIRFSFAEPRLFDDEERTFILAVASQGAQALDRVRLLQDERAVADQLAFVADASQVLAESLDYTRTLRTIADHAVSTVADWCAVYLMERRHIRTVAVSRADESAGYEDWDLDVRFPVDRAPVGVPRVIATGEAELYPEVTDALLVESGFDEYQMEIVRRLDVRSAITVPLTARGRTFGAIILSRTGSRPQFDEGDLTVALALAQRAAVAVNNAVLYQHEIDVAQALQRGLLPPALPSVPGVEVAAAYRPAAEDVGGDFYDLWPLADDVWGLAVGDVCGTGADAATFNAVARATLRALSIGGAGPAEWLRGLNAALLLGPAEPPQGERFCTVVAGTLRIDGRVARLRLATGGHPPPILRHPRSAPAMVRLSGTLLGAFDEVRIGELDLRLEPGDQLVLYTDGVTDVRRPDGTTLGERGLLELLGSLGQSAEVLVDELVDRLWSDRPPEDDVALLVLAPRRDPDAGPTARPD
ncbi:MAG TPA: SpoIIE family protein phosphatase, partial [Acidimicrobiales bacterium]|nr:SpoIIE family protein phosphatase [Acidimicrobiales bacterium]